MCFIIETSSSHIQSCYDVESWPIPDDYRFYTDSDITPQQCAEFCKRTGSQHGILMKHSSVNMTSCRAFVKCSFNAIVQHTLYIIPYKIFHMVCHTHYTKLLACRTTEEAATLHIFAEENHLQHNHLQHSQLQDNHLHTTAGTRRVDIIHLTVGLTHVDQQMAPLIHHVINNHQVTKQGYCNSWHLVVPIC